MSRRSRVARSTPGKSALLTAKMSATSVMPAFITCTPSPVPGEVTTTTESATSQISSSDWPTPTVSTRTISQPSASSSLTAPLVASETPPR